MKKVLPPDFFDRPTIEVAKDLLGKYLVRIEPNGTRLEKMITEVEAYDGPEDKASHASRGQTPRNAVMFGPAGFWYVYFVYGMHFMLNIVTREKGYPAAVLIRGVEGINGPARVTKYFKIDRGFSGRPSRRISSLWIEDQGVVVNQKDIKRLPRVGVGYAGPVWSKKKYRLVVSSKLVSNKQQNND